MQSPFSDLTYASEYATAKRRGAWVWHPGNWTRTRLWAVYWGYVTYLFIHNAWVAIGVAAAAEAGSMAMGGWGATRAAPMRDTAVDAALRTVNVFVGVFAGVFVSYAADLTRIEGMRELGYGMLAIVFVVLRELAPANADYAIYVVHFVLFVTLGDAVFFAEPWTYGALAVYGVATLVMQVCAGFWGYASFAFFVATLIAATLGIYLLTMNQPRLPLWDYYIVDN